MPEFWEEAFKENQAMWGFEPAKSAVLAKDLFIANGVRHVLVPGIGYGRNALVFMEHGMKVTGIEISKTAIDIARQHLGEEMTIYHGSVTDMPFDEQTYDGIFCYGLIYLLDKNERAKLIADCFNQLAENGIMVFTAITKEADTYGKGTRLSQDRYAMFGGVNIFFYDTGSIKEEFGHAGLTDVSIVAENYPFYIIQCKKVKEIVSEFVR